MKKIFKYAMVSPEIEMPKGSRILDFQMQNDLPCIWAIVDPEAPKTTRAFRILGTGHDVPPGLSYIGTTQQEPFVWHLFEQVNDA